MITSSIFLSSSVCPRGFPTLEQHIEANHGNVCRSGQEGPLGIGWKCPGTCVGRMSQPWCMATTTDASPCRVGKML